MIIVGIDYSITGPAICVHHGLEWDIDNCQFHYLTGTYKYQQEYFDGKVVGKNTKDKEISWFCDAQRYHSRYLWVQDCLYNSLSEAYEFGFPEDFHLGLEGYSMNSKGLITSIVENAATLKVGLFNNHGLIPTIYAPTEIKKFATGKGNAQKHTMFAHFLDETGWDLHELISPDKKVGTDPVAGLVDAYYVCKRKHYGVMNRGRR